MIDPFSPEEVEFLKKARTERGWYLYTDNARSIIDGLCDRQLMSANGAMKMIDRAEPDSIKILDLDVPVIGTLVSYYELIRYGRAAFAILHQDNELANSPPVNSRGGRR